MRKRLLICGAVVGLLPVTAFAGAPSCAAFEPSTKAQPAAKRSLQPDDLVNLRDLGPVYADEGRAELFTLSPDRTKLAFQLRRANLETNGYCLGIFVLDIASKAQLAMIDEGGELIRARNIPFGLTEMMTGNPAVITPKWSPDAQWIAYLRQENGRVGVWRARVDGTGSEAVGKLPFNAEDFAWTEDGEGLVVKARPQLAKSIERIDQEGKSGFLYDERWAPLVSKRPFPLQPISSEYFLIDVQSGSVRPATPREAALLTVDAENAPAKARIIAAGLKGALAWVAPTTDLEIDSPSSLSVRFADKRKAICVRPECQDIFRVWWSADGKAIRFLRRTGWDRSEVALYTWLPGQAVPRRIMLTEDVLYNCQDFQGDEVICGREGSLRPRHLVLINTETGKSRVVFDPNPEIQSISLGSVRRLGWTNAFGIKAFGDLILPPAHRVGQVHPLIVVQYSTRGFLRGGTGDDYPIQLFANAGFAVLSVNRPRDYGLLKGATTYDEVDHLNKVGWADKKSTLLSIEEGIRQSAALGVVDPHRVGITGLSDGATTVQYAISNTGRFAAAALSSGMEDRTSVMTLLGPSYARSREKLGFPRLTDDSLPFWGPYSLVLNAKHITTPLLIQQSDNEMLGVLEGYTALKEQGKPVELYIFPDEFHIKWQPVHRRAAYVRSLDWFNFWLLGIEDADPAKAGQYDRWRALRSAARTSKMQTDGAPIVATP